MATDVYLNNISGHCVTTEISHYHRADAALSLWECAGQAWENMKRKFRFITKNLDGVPEVSKDTAAFLHLFTSFSLGQEMQLYCFSFCCVY